MKPTRGVRSWETAANESQWRCGPARSRGLVKEPMKDGVALKAIDIFWTGRGALDGVVIAFRGPFGCLYRVIKTTFIVHVPHDKEASGPMITPGKVGYVGSRLANSGVDFRIDLWAWTN